MARFFGQCVCAIGMNDVYRLEREGVDDGDHAEVFTNLVGAAFSIADFDLFGYVVKRTIVLTEGAPDPDLIRIALVL